MNTRPQDQPSAQREADRVRILRAEIDQLEQERVLELTSVQRERFDAWSRAKLADLSTRFDVDTTMSEKRVSWGLRIASTLGGLALCAALVMFFTHVWGFLDTPVQVILLFATPLAALAGTEYAARRERTLYFAGLMALVTLAAFILNLEVLGRIFNITSTEKALLACGALALLLAYRYGLRLLLLFGIGFVLSYLAATFAAQCGCHWLQFADRPEHFGALGLAVFAAPRFLRHERHTDFPPVYRFAGALAFFVAVLSLSEWGAHSYLPFETKSVELFYELVGLAASACAIWLGILRQWNGVVNTGSVFFVIFLYCRLYHWMWDLMPKYAFFGAIGAIAILLVLAFRRVRVRLKRESGA